MKYLVIHLLKYTTLTNIYKVVLYNELYIIHCNNIIFVVVKKKLFCVVTVNRSLMSLTMSCSVFLNYITLDKQHLYI